MGMQDNRAKALQHAEKLCEERGVRLTEPRRKVLAVLLGKDGPLKAYDIIAAMTGAKPMTVYRALDFLSRTGLVHRIESLNAYIACVERHCEHKDSQYLVCDACGRVEELHNHAIDKFIADRLGPSGFAVTYKTVEIHGTCRACAA